MSNRIFVTENDKITVNENATFTAIVAVPVAVVYVYVPVKPNTLFVVNS